jgi:hypothetical protein
MIFTLLSSLGFGLGSTLLLFGSILCYTVFFGEREFGNSLVPMGLSFGFLTVGMALLYGVLV